MSEKIELTAEMIAVAGDHLPVPLPYIAPALTAALAHPSFQSQLRAYVAGEMRKMVPDEDNPYRGDMVLRVGWNAAIRATLANIAAYEKGEPQ